MKAYEDIAAGISEEYGEEVKEVGSILYRSSIATFLFGLAIFAIYSLRDLLSGIGSAIAVSILTSSLSVLFLLLLVDLIIGLARQKVTNEGAEPEIEYSYLERDIFKGMSALLFGSFSILIASRLASPPLTGLNLRDLTLLRPIYEQMFSAGITLIGISYLLIGIYVLVCPALFLKKNFDLIRQTARS